MMILLYFYPLNTIMSFLVYILYWLLFIIIYYALKISVIISALNNNSINKYIKYFLFLSTEHISSLSHSDVNEKNFYNSSYNRLIFYLLILIAECISPLLLMSLIGY